MRRSPTTWYGVSKKTLERLAKDFDGAYGRLTARREGRLVVYETRRAEMSMKVYCCHPISGMSADEVFSYYERIAEELEDSRYEVLTPMHCKDVLRTEMEFKATNYRHPVATNHAIYNRDKWMVGQADVVFANLVGSTIVSMGTVMEMAWASDKGKHVVLCMEPDNIHRHAFVLEAADVIFETEEEAMDYLRSLAGKLRAEK